VSYIRRLPSGKWQATVRGPDGRKHTKTDLLKKVVRTWATEQEANFRQGRCATRGPVMSASATGGRATRRRPESSGSRRTRTRRCGQFIADLLAG
jgi:hypothetical protein